MASASAFLLWRIFTLRCWGGSCFTEESSDQYSWHIAGSLVLISVFLFASDRGRQALVTNPYTDVFLWHQIDRRQNNENADQYLSFYHWLRLLCTTDFDDIFVRSVLKSTLSEPNYKEMEVHWPIRKTNSGLGKALFFLLFYLARFVWVRMK